MPTTASSEARATAAREMRPGCQVSCAELADEGEVLEHGGDQHDDAEHDQRDARPDGEPGGVDGHIRLGAAQLAQEKAEAGRTAKPMPIRPRPVRIQARKVRSMPAK